MAPLQRQVAHGGQPQPSPEARRGHPLPQQQQASQQRHHGPRGPRLVVHQRARAQQQPARAQAQGRNPQGRAELDDGQFAARFGQEPLPDLVAGREQGRPRQ